MIFKKDELSSTVIVATNDVLQSMYTLNFLLTSNIYENILIEDMFKNISDHAKTIKFAENVLDNLTDDAKRIVIQNLKLINEAIVLNNKIISEKS